LNWESGEGFGDSFSGYQEPDLWQEKTLGATFRESKWRVKVERFTVAGRCESSVGASGFQSFFLISITAGNAWHCSPPEVSETKLNSAINPIL
jgi:hypothetical protein